MTRLIFCYRQFQDRFVLLYSLKQYAGVVDLTGRFLSVQPKAFDFCHQLSIKKISTTLPHSNRCCRYRREWEGSKVTELTMERRVEVLLPLHIYDDFSCCSPVEVELQMRRQQVFNTSHPRPFCTENTRKKKKKTAICHFAVESRRLGKVAPKETKIKKQTCASVSVLTAAELTGQEGVRVTVTRRGRPLTL